MVLTPLLFLWENVLTLTAQKGHHKYFSRDSSGSKPVIILLCSLDRATDGEARDGGRGERWQSALQEPGGDGLEARG